MYPLNLYWGYGVNTGKRFDRFIGDLLALKTGNPDVTFEEVSIWIILYLVCTHVSVYCSYSNKLQKSDNEDIFTKRHR